MVVIDVFGDDETKVDKDDDVDRDAAKKRLEAMYEIAKRSPALDVVPVTQGPTRRSL